MQYFEDYAVGQKYGSARRRRVEAAEIKDFAAEYDPQPLIDSSQSNSKLKEYNI